METDFAKAWRLWLDSDEGRQCCNGETLQVPLYLNRFLQNRINLAFAAGYNAKTNADSAGASAE